MKTGLTLIASILIFLGSVYSQEDKTYLFISNGTAKDKVNQLIKGISYSNELEIISLGDNAPTLLNSLIETYPESKLRTVIGDKDIDLLLNPKADHFKFKKKRICPDPVVKELDDNLVMIRLNSNWFIDREFKFDAQNYDCDFFNEIHLLEELEDILEDYNDWNKIIVTHHGLESITERSGKGLGYLNLIPLYGQLYQAFRKNIGYKQDLASTEYHTYITLLSKIIEKFDRLCIISGHDYLNSVISNDHITHINVNSSDQNHRFSKSKNTRFASDLKHILQLQKKEDQWTLTMQSENGPTIIEQVFQSKDTEEKQKIEGSEIGVQTVTRASEKYDAGKVTRFFMGDGYREEWSTPVKAPLLDLDTYDGGLRPYAIGGGLQTMSVKFKSKNGKKYAFRVLDKQPEKSLSDIARESVYRVIVQELITTMHPYGPLVANRLLEATDIIHIKPELFILADHPKLKNEFEQFVGKIGTLEEKPSGKKKGREGFHGADKVVSSFDMFISLRKSYKNKIDKLAYAKARLMDMYLGDWDRHEDNWKWAMYKEDDQKIYHPIPKDRDHVFSKWTGLIPNIADFAINNAENFGDMFGNKRHLNFKSRFLDRELATELSLEDWLEASAYLQEKLTDEVIDDAVSQLPEEVYLLRAEELKRKLKSRRGDLDRFIREYYLELNSLVYITGTNKSDWFKIERHEDGSVEVKIYDIKKDGSLGPLFFERIFEPNVVKTLYCFGLDGKDQFDVNGNVSNSIKVRIIGGSDEDSIKDNSNVEGRRKMTQVYDSFHKDNVVKSKETTIKRPSRPAHYDPYAFDYNWLIPALNLRNSSGNGLGFGLGVNYLIRGFNKPGFAKKWSFGGIYYPDIRAHRLQAGYTHRHIVGLSDFILRSQYSTLYDRFPFYYGIGNNVPFNRRRRRELNRINYDYFNLEGGLETTFAKKSTWVNTVIYEYHNTDNRGDVTILDSSVQGFGTNSFLSLKSDLELDFTDNSLYPEGGSQFNLSLEGRSDFEGRISSNINARFSQYYTLNLGLKTTFIGSLHYKQANGDLAFYHLSRLGSQTQFRGYTRNRFIDKYAMLYNTEIRVILGTVKTPLIQFVVGIYGFHDAGKVWNDSSEFYSNNWNDTYGGGFFIAPGSTNYKISYIFARQEDDYTYSKFQLGLDF